MSLLLLFNQPSGGGPTTYTLNADPGVFTFSGLLVNLLRQARISVSPGTFAQTGVNALLKRGYKVTPGAAVFTLGSPGANTRVQRVLQTGVGSFAMVGNDAILYIPGPAVPPDPARTVFVIAEDRRVGIASQDRLVAILLEDRAVELDTESRIAAVLTEDRIVKPS